MNHYKKRLIKNTILIPIIAAVITTALFFVALTVFSSQFPFTKNNVSLSSYEQADVMNAESVDRNGGTVSKKDIPPISSNTVFGKAEANGKSIELIYDANDVNALKRLNIPKGSKLVGETGTVFSTCYKSDADFIRLLKVGDEIELTVNYGSYSYEVINVKTVDSLNLAQKQGDGIGRAFVLCTDGNDDVGISDSYFTVVCKMTGGKAVTE